jgi:hypothetical protein
MSGIPPELPPHGGVPERRHNIIVHCMEQSDAAQWNLR